MLIDSDNWTSGPLKNHTGTRNPPFALCGLAWAQGERDDPPSAEAMALVRERNEKQVPIRWWQFSVNTAREKLNRQYRTAHPDTAPYQRTWLTLSGGPDNKLPVYA